MSNKPEKQMKKGNPFQRGKTWTYVVYIPSVITGKSKPKWFSGFATKQEAFESMQERKAEIKLGLYKEPSKQSVKEYMLDWFENVHKPFLKPNTAKGYEVNIRNHILPYIGDVRFVDLNRNQIMKFYNELLKSGNVKNSPNGQQFGLSPTTYYKYVYNVLSKGLKEAVLSGLIEKNPCDGVKLPKRKKYKAVVLNHQQIVDLVDGTKNTDIYAITFCSSIGPSSWRGFRANFLRF